MSSKMLSLNNNKEHKLDAVVVVDISNEDDDNSSSVASDFSDHTSTFGDEEESRDEIQEIRKNSKKETFRIRSMRLMVTGILLVTAVAVTVTTYWLLNKDEYRNFEIAYEQFARTVGDAAVDQQRNVRDSLESLTSAISILAESNNANWPNFYPPKFEKYAQDYMKLSRAEWVGLNNIVKPNQRDSYIEYATQHYQDWTKEGHMLAHGNLDLLNTDPTKYNAFVSQKTADGFIPDMERDYYSVRVTASPPPRAYGPVTNLNIGSLGTNEVITNSIFKLRNETLVSHVRPFKALPADEHLNFHTDSEADHPHSFYFHAIHDKAEDPDSEIVATVNSAIAWDASLLNLLPDSVEGIYSVIKNNCDQSFSYEIVGKDAFYRGEGDFHDTKYDEYEVQVNLSPHTHQDFASTPDHCMYYMFIYPSDNFRESYNSNTPEIFAAAVAATFGLVALVFFVYDVLVQQRNEKLIAESARSNAIVTSLFPGMIRDRILQQNNTNSKKNNPSNLKSHLKSKSPADGGDVKKDGQGEMDSKPLADLFLETTVIFADIVGFTAWSSIREPSQVFILLETVYSSFDEMAKRRRVFKVETVGDCYVGVTGLPEPRSDHAVVMARFARACMAEMHILTKKLEVTLGPDTGELSLRIGIHSGPVTAGVLRGERSRFQLFGDTMNTTSRIESSGRPGKIHVSEETAKLLIDGGKESWIKAREDRVVAKGKGFMDTYWLTLQRHDECSTGGGSSEENGTDVNPSPTRLDDITELGETDSLDDDGALDERIGRLIEWNSNMLLQIIQQIIARRTAKSASNKISSYIAGVISDDNLFNKASMPLEEVKEIITLPAFDRKIARRQQDPETVEVPAAVTAQLQDYVTCIAKMYNENSFHSFDHASHVVMSVVKLMSRIVLPKDISGDSSSTDQEDASRSGSKSTSRYIETSAASLHDHTYGITSDPLTQFACAFSALIHDVDHSGVPNPRLIEENPDLSALYKGRSVAEQNSLDISWNLLMEDRYKDLRAALCSDDLELSRFRQLVINSVMATDLGDKELKELRNNRWDKAFKKEDGDSSAEKSDMPVFEIGTSENYRDAVNRKATIVIEHLIQASDVSHTMQHWHVYRKWNERLFMEMYDAYKNGRSTTNPADFWYKGEIGFFDFYIIPLAKKLKDCGVFGISSDEYLNYAKCNRAEWEARGQEVVAEMMMKIEKEAASSS